MQTIVLNNKQAFVVFLGRVLLSFIFLVSAAMKVLDWQNTTARLAEIGFLFVPFTLTLAILFELCGGLALLSGCKARFAAMALSFYMIPTVMIFHGFWASPGEGLARIQGSLELLAIMGGLFLVAGFGPGPMVLDLQGRPKKIETKGATQAPSPIPKSAGPPPEKETRKSAGVAYS